MTIEKREFSSAAGETLAARFDRPDGGIRGYALFAHCFTCTKDIIAARRIAGHLANLGVAVLRFDFTGLGSSQGEFANTSFASNVDDLVAAADYLASKGEAPTLLIGHSLGGAAVLAAAERIKSVKGVATIGAPSDAEHVLHMFEDKIGDIEREGSAEVLLAGRKFRIGKGFVDAARSTVLDQKIANLRASLLVLHSPIDNTVGIDNATRIFTAAKHPKSFVSLGNADHLLTKDEDATFAAEMISAWASRLLPKEPEEAVAEDTLEHVRVSETRQSKFQNTVHARKHRFFADEPASVGGTDTGPSPYDFLSTALGACTSMTLRMYADFKKLDLGKVTVDVSHDKVHAKDCADCTQESIAAGGKIDRFERVISIEGTIAPEIEQKIVEIANKCPVHKTLEGKATVITRVKP
ncbi:MAG: alpha/beta fold hydrolase [Pseudomonadota bacterium]